MAAILGGATVGGNVPFLLEELSHPYSASASVVLMVAGTAAVYRWPANPAAGDARRRMASTIDRLSDSGSVLLEWCFHASPADLPQELLIFGLVDEQSLTG